MRGGGQLNLDGFRILKIFAQTSTYSNINKEYIIPTTGTYRIYAIGHGGNGQKGIASTANGVTSSGVYRGSYGGPTGAYSIRTQVFNEKDVLNVLVNDSCAQVSFNDNGLQTVLAYAGSSKMTDSGTETLGSAHSGMVNQDGKTAMNNFEVTTSLDSSAAGGPGGSLAIPDLMTSFGGGGGMIVASNVRGRPASTSDIGLMPFGAGGGGGGYISLGSVSGSGGDCGMGAVIIEYLSE